LDEVPPELELVVISQSCDIAQSVESEPYVEVIIAVPIERANGNLTHNKNARLLDTTITVATNDSQVSRTQNLQLSATKKLLIPKRRFAQLTPSRNKTLPRSLAFELAAWCAARYCRPALPTDFNEALAKVDRGGKKRRRLAKKVSKHTSAIYVEINPNRELLEGEHYIVNLLGVTLPSAAMHKNDVEVQMVELRELMESAGMEVELAIRGEDEVSLAVRRRFEPLHLDDISFKNSDALPPDIDTH